MTQRWTLTFGQTLRSVRMIRGLTMGVIAEKSGHNQSSLSLIERDKIVPSASFLRDIAPFYGCPYWSQAHNVSWLTMIPPAAARTDDARDPNALYLYLDIGVQIRDLLTQAMAQDPSIAPLYRQCIDVLGLPGLTPLSTVETAPLWGWMAEMLGIDELASQTSEDDPLQAKRILSNTLTYCRENRIGMNLPNMAGDLRAARLARKWSSAELARKASRQLQLAGEPTIHAADIEHMEQELGEVNVVRWIALAHALELPLSQILPTLASSTADELETIIQQVLKHYGLSQRAIDVLTKMIQLLKSYEDHRLVPD